MRTAPRDRTIRSALLHRVPTIRHAFTTAVHPTRPVPLTLARGPEASDDDLERAWAAVATTLEPTLGPDDVALLDQVHGARVVEVARPAGPCAPVARADAAWTHRTNVVLGVRTADCVPVLVAGPNTIAVAHAGWRGVASRVVPALIAALVDAGERADALRVAIGPAISGEVYEVGDEVVEGLRGAGLADADFMWPSARGDRGAHVDLPRAVAAQLYAAGVRVIDDVGVCTFRDGRMHSHRRDGARAGRQAGIIARLA